MLITLMHTLTILHTQQHKARASDDSSSSSSDDDANSVPKQSQQPALTRRRTGPSAAATAAQQGVYTALRITLHYTLYCNYSAASYNVIVPLSLFAAEITVCSVHCARMRALIL